MSRQFSLFARSLGSSSAGNSTLIWDATSSILIDFGFSTSYTLTNLRHCGKSIEDITCALITHTHSDHINGYMLVMLLKHGVPVYCNENLIPVIHRKFAKYIDSGNSRHLQGIADKEFTAGSFSIRSFPVPHDSEGGCFGFKLTNTINELKKQICFATDMGFQRIGIVEEFVNSDLIVIESNHDIGMLERSNRPADLKDRIRKIGHLSNDETIALVIDSLSISTTIPKAILLTHLSRHCNAEHIVLNSLREALDKNNFREVQLVVAHHDKPSGIISA